MIFLLQPFTLGNLSPRIFPGPRRGLQAFGPAERILIHEALTDLEASAWIIGITLSNFNPRGPHGPRLGILPFVLHVWDFNPRGPHGPRRSFQYACVQVHVFQSTRPSRTSTILGFLSGNHFRISIHEALTDLDPSGHIRSLPFRNFNPRGPHGPRHYCSAAGTIDKTISIHEALTDLDMGRCIKAVAGDISIHEALTDLDINGKASAELYDISIHEALTDLDYRKEVELVFLNISIHEALTDLDAACKATSTVQKYFNPRGPHGPRHALRLCGIP